MGLLPKPSLGRVRTSTSKSDCRKPKKKVSIEKRVHRVDITESSSDQFPTRVFNFEPYGVWAAQGIKGKFFNYAKVCYF